MNLARSSPRPLPRSVAQGLGGRSGSTGPVFYVAAGGNDLDDGKSINTPWQSLSKLNAESASFEPGTTARLKYGDTFAGALIPTSSGISGKRITYSAWGSSGDGLPVINAAGQSIGVSLGSADWTQIDSIRVQGATNTNLGTNAGNHLVRLCEIADSLDQNVGCDDNAVMELVSCNILSAADDGVSIHPDLAAPQLTLRSCFLTGNNQHINSAVSAFVASITLIDSYFLGGTNQLQTRSPVQARRCRFAALGTDLQSQSITNGDFFHCAFDASAAVDTDKFRFTIGTTGGGTHKIYNCDFWGGDGVQTKGDIWTTESLDIRNCIYFNWNRLFNAGAGSVVADRTNSDIRVGGFDSETNPIAGDPLLIDPANNNWGYGVGSPVEDAGLDVGEDTDYEGKTIVLPPSVGAVD